MRVSRAQFQENREKIVKAAGRLFRERGFDAVSVADVMKAAGLTHGGFYGHFKSKDDLIAQAAVEASDRVVESWSAIAEAHGPGALKALGELYLDDSHLNAPGAGCLVATLGSDIARRPAEAREGVTASIKRVAAMLQKAAPGKTEAVRRKRALAAYASWVGAMVLARMSDDEAFSQEVLAAVADG